LECWDTPLKYTEVTPIRWITEGMIAIECKVKFFYYDNTEFDDQGEKKLAEVIPMFKNMPEPPKERESMFTVFVFRDDFKRMFIPKYDGTFSSLNLAIRCEGRLQQAEDAIGIVDKYGKCHFALFKEKEGADGDN
jgi:hypothetical protein